MKEKAWKSNRHMTTHLAYRQISFAVVWQWQFDSPCVHVPATHRRSVCLPYGNAANVAAMATETAAAAATTSKATQQSNNQTTTTNYNISNLTLRLSHNVLVTHWSSLRSHLFSCELWRQFFFFFYYLRSNFWCGEFSCWSTCEPKSINDFSFDFNFVY